MSGIKFSKKLKASISDICDIRMNPISEPEAWAILYQGVKQLRNSFLNGDLFKGHNLALAFIITPDTLNLEVNGTVSFQETLKRSVYAASHFLAPEILIGQKPTLIQHVEAAYVFSLGAVVFWALTFQGIVSLSYKG